MSLVATDGHRLALVTVPTRDGTVRRTREESRPILPKKTLGELSRLLDRRRRRRAASRKRRETICSSTLGDRMLISRMIDGQFPAYERVIPKGNDKHIEFDRDRLHERGDARARCCRTNGRAP